MYHDHVLMSDTTGSMPDTAFQIHSSFRPLLSEYDGFILDQFGVMHNGSHGLDGAAEAVSTMSKLGKKIIILSNSSSSSEATVAKLPRLGFDPDVFVGAVTSGEEAGHFIRSEYGTPGTREDGGTTAVRRKALFITWATPKSPSPMDFIAKCGDIDIASSVEDADFIICHGANVVRGPGPDGTAIETSLGSFPMDGNMDLIDPILLKCKERNLTMVCANPDFVMVKPDGTRGHMPGKIAKRYEEMGGTVSYFGKPHVPHFEACIRDLGLPKDRVAHVGDSLHHDIAGANASGIPCVFVAGGVHREELGSHLGEVPDEAALEKLFEKHGEVPTHVVPMLKLD